MGISYGVRRWRLLVGGDEAPLTRSLGFEQDYYVGNFHGGNQPNRVDDFVLLNVTNMPILLHNHQLSVNTAELIRICLSSDSTAIKSGLYKVFDIQEENLKSTEHSSLTDIINP